MMVTEWSKIVKKRQMHFLIPDGLPERINLWSFEFILETWKNSLVICVVFEIEVNSDRMDFLSNEMVFLDAGLRRFSM